MLLLSDNVGDAPVVSRGQPIFPLENRFFGETFARFIDDDGKATYHPTHRDMKHIMIIALVFSMQLWKDPNQLMEELRVGPHQHCEMPREKGQGIPSALPVK